MRALVWGHHVGVVDKPVPPIPEGWVLGKVLAAMFGPIERAIVMGIQPIEPGRVLGSFGVMRIVERGVGVEDLGPGQVVAVPAYCMGSIVGVDMDGLLADYASVPKECVRLVPSEFLSPLTPLWLEFSFLEGLAEVVAGKDTLAIGCGFTGYVTASYLRRVTNLTVACVERGLMEEIGKLGVRTMMLDSVEGSYDVVILEPLSTYATLVALRFLKDGGILVLPPTQPKIVLKYMGFPSRLTLYRPGFGNLAIGRDAIGAVPKKIMSQAVVTVKNLDEVRVMSRYYGRVIYVSRHMPGSGK